MINFIILELLSMVLVIQACKVKTDLSNETESLQTPQVLPTTFSVNHQELGIIYLHAKDSENKFPAIVIGQSQHQYFAVISKKDYLNQCTKGCYITNDTNKSIPANNIDNKVASDDSEPLEDSGFENMPSAEDAGTPLDSSIMVDESEKESDQSSVSKASQSNNSNDLNESAIQILEWTSVPKNTSLNKLQLIVFNQTLPRINSIQLSNQPIIDHGVIWVPDFSSPESSNLIYGEVVQMTKVQIPLLLNQLTPVYQKNNEGYQLTALAFPPDHHVEVDIDGDIPFFYEVFTIQQLANLVPKAVSNLISSSTKDVSSMSAVSFQDLCVKLETIALQPIDRKDETLYQLDGKIQEPLSQSFEMLINGQTVSSKRMLNEDNQPILSFTLPNPNLTPFTKGVHLQIASPKNNYFASCFCHLSPLNCNYNQRQPIVVLGE